MDEIDEIIKTIKEKAIQAGKSVDDWITSKEGKDFIQHLGVHLFILVKKVLGLG